MDPRRELNQINRNIARQSRAVGEAIVWYEFIPFGSGSEYDDVYDESPMGAGGLEYRPGVPLLALYVEELEDSNRSIEDGRQPIQNMRAVVPMYEFVKAGITEPWEYQQHLRDLFFYDGRYYKVIDFKVRGRLREDAIVSIEGNETYIDQEFTNAELTTANEPSVQNLPWPDTFPR